jgi:hypothetical protein
MPICNDCKLVSEVGVVCSEACLDAIKQFQDRVKEDAPRPKRSWISRGLVRSLLAIVILFGIAYAILCFRLRRILSPSDVLDQLDTWVRFFGTYF